MVYSQLPCPATGAGGGRANESVASLKRLTKVSYKLDMEPGCVVCCLQWQRKMCLYMNGWRSSSPIDVSSTRGVPPYSDPPSVYMYVYVRGE